MSIKVLSGALDENSSGDIFIRGVIAPESLRALKVDDYQREVLPISTINKLVRAFKKGSVPDIELGMRGHRILERDGNYHLQDSVYIVDGLQRVTAALLLVESGDSEYAHVGAKVEFGTTPEWERERFRVLNQDRLKLSPNVLLRNWRHDHASVAMLYNLSQDESFVMHGRVSWNQRMLRKELMTAANFAKISGRLHSQFAPTRSTRIDRVVTGIDKVYEEVGPKAFKANIETFFNSVDSAWGIKRVQFKQGATYIKGGYLVSLARLFSNHTDFWRGKGDKELYLEPRLMKKIAQFPYSDPQVAQLAGGGGTALDILYMLMVNHINSGRRSGRLNPRNVDYMDIDDKSTEEQEQS